MLPFFDNFISFCYNGMIEAMIQPQLVKNGANTTESGFIFLLWGGVYMVSCIFAGYVSNYF